MRKVILTIAAATAGLWAAAQINCQPGKLSSLVTDVNVTSLAITGQMDARDFKFIATELNQLKEVNLRDVEIVAWEDLGTPTLAGLHSFAAGEVPTMSLAGKQYLTTVVLPASATSLGQAALAACPALTSVTMGPALATVGDYALSGCTSITAIELPSSVRTVGTGAFSRCSQLRNFTVGTTGQAAESLTVGNEAFLECTRLTAVDLGPNLTSIGDMAFAGTGMSGVDLSTYKKLASMGDYVYAKSRVTTATLPSTALDMGKGAFVYNQQLTHVTLPEGLDALPGYTLAGVDGLTQVDLGDIKTMGDYALYGTTSLTNVTIPARVTFIGTRAMAGMTGLESVTSEAVDVPALGQDVWQGVDQPAVRLLVAAKSLDSYAQAAQWCEFKLGANVLLGDADGDGQISISDVNIIINGMLGRAKNLLPQADTNGDGEYDIQDVNYVINVMLKRTPETYIIVEPNTSSTIAIADFSIAPGETRDIDLMLDNTEQVGHLQCDITLPQGLTLVGARVADRAQHHSLLTDVEDGNLRLICYSPDSKPIEGYEGAVATLRVRADESLQSEGTITIDNVVMASGIDNKLVAEATTARVSNASGVDDVNAAIARVYAAGSTLVIESQTAGRAQLVSTNGMSRNLDVVAGRNEYEPGTGIYIVRLAGKSHKVAVK